LRKETELFGAECEAGIEEGAGSLMKSYGECPSLKRKRSEE